MRKKFEDSAAVVLVVATIALLCLMFSTCEAQDLRSCVVKTYTSQIGVREATGKNDGKEVEKYLASVKLGKGFAWCAAFVNYSLETCGCNRAKSAWSPDWFPNKSWVVWTGKTGGLRGPPPRSGDVFGIYFPDKGRIAHVGFIHEWNGNHVTTVEGNTNGAGSREGDGVYKKIRLTKQIYATANWIGQ